MMPATEELSHIEFLGHAVAMNLEAAPVGEKEEAAKDPVVHAIWAAPIRGRSCPRGSARCR